MRREENECWAVTVSRPESMNLLGLMLSNILRRRLAERSGRRHASAIHGDVVIEASGMIVTLAFEPSHVEISRRTATHPLAQIRGTLVALLEAALGEHVAQNFLSKNLRVRGNAGALWHVFSLVKAR